MFAPDLFVDASALLPSILTCPDFLAPNDHERLINWCRTKVTWHGATMNFGRGDVPVPRQLAWFGDVAYAYSGLRHPATVMPVPLRALADQIETWLASRGRRATFNSVLMNHYRDGADSIGMHSDDETQIEKHSAIASVSLGATCVFRFEHKETRLKLAEPLVGGSLLVMMDDTQDLWRHGIRKEPGRGPRVNLTYRFTNPR